MAFKGKATSGDLTKLYLWQAAVQGAATDKWIYVSTDSAVTIAVSGYIDDQEFIDQVGIGAEVTAIRVGTISDTRTIVEDFTTGGITSISQHVVTANDGTTVDLSATPTTVVTSSTDHAVARFDGAAGVLQDSGVLVDDNANITNVNSMFQDEQAAKDTTVAGDGQWWTKNTAPNTPFFTNDADTDFELARFAAAQVDHAIARADGTDGKLQDSGVKIDDNRNVTNVNSLFQDEQAAKDTTVTGDGQWWVKSSAPNEPMFTDDADTDFELARFAAAQTDHAVPRADTTNGKLQTSGVIIDDSDNVTGVAALTCTTLNSNGIDDNASSERVEINDASFVLGPADTSSYRVSRSLDTGGMVISGGNSTNTGLNFIMYGGSRATLAKDLLVRSNTTTVLDWDDSASEWTFGGVIVAKSYTVGTLPTAVAGGVIYVTDDGGGATLSYSNGSNWLVVYDATTIA